MLNDSFAFFNVYAWYAFFNIMILFFTLIFIKTMKLSGLIFDYYSMQKSKSDYFALTQ